MEALHEEQMAREAAERLLADRMGAIDRSLQQTMAVARNAREVGEVAMLSRVEEAVSPYASPPANPPMAMRHTRVSRSLATVETAGPAGRMWTPSSKATAQPQRAATEITPWATALPWAPTHL